MGRTLISIAKEMDIDLEKELRRMYLDEKIGCTNIAKHFNVSPMTIHNHLKKFNIKTRDRVEAVKLVDRSGPNNGMYGKRFSDKYKREQSERLKKAIKKRGGHWTKGRVMTEEEKQMRSKVMRDANKHTIGNKYKTSHGYIEVRMGQGATENMRGTEYEHRLVMEEYLGRKLTKDEVVHHINDDKSDNRIENLKLMTNEEHARFHHRQNNKRRWLSDENS